MTKSIEDSKHMPKISGELSLMEKKTILKWIKSHPHVQKKKNGSVAKKHWALAPFEKPSFPNETSVDYFIKKSYPNIELEKIPSILSTLLNDPFSRGYILVNARDDRDLIEREDY